MFGEGWGLLKNSRNKGREIGKQTDRQTQTERDRDR